MKERRDYHNGEDWKNKREVIQEAPYPKYWTPEIVQAWINELTDNPELDDSKETPIREIDLTLEDADKINGGLGKILVKDESDRSVNPTGTMKDRMARNMAWHYLTQAKRESDAIKNTPKNSILSYQKSIPRYSLLTAGNAGVALARLFAKLNLPPPKLLLDKSTDKKVVELLKQYRADIYMTDLETNPFSGLRSEQDPLDEHEILILTNNSKEGGYDLTAAGGANENTFIHAIFYAGIGKDIFPQHPDEVYPPVGSGVLHGDLIISQYLCAATAESEEESKKLASVKILGAEPEDPHSIADKLTAPAKPFMPFDQERLDEAKELGHTHQDTGIYKVSENEIKEAFELMKKYGDPNMKIEPSGAAGLALYIKRKRAGLVPENAKVIVINTGCGIISEKAA
jgi:hypothetical protein